MNVSHPMSCFISSHVPPWSVVSGPGLLLLYSWEGLDYFWNLTMVIVNYSHLVLAALVDLGVGQSSDGLQACGDAFYLPSRVCRPFPLTARSLTTVSSIPAMIRIFSVLS